MSITVRDILELDILNHSEIISGRGGLDREVTRVNFTDCPIQFNELEYSLSLKGDLYIRSLYWVKDDEKELYDTFYFYVTSKSSCCLITNEYLPDLPKSINIDAERRSRMPGLFSEYDSYYIPYSLLETERLERYFEQKAKEGHLIKKYSYGRQNGKFIPAAPAQYHFSIGVYHKSVTKETEHEKQFEEFRKRWEVNGWLYQTSIKNLVIFYSQEEERPPVPDMRVPYCRPEAFKVTVKAENRALLGMTGMNLLCMTPYWLLFFGPFKQGKQGGIAEVLAGLLFAFLMFWTWETSGLAILLRQRAALRMKKATGRIPEFNLFWEEASLSNAGYMTVASLVLAYGTAELAERLVVFSCLAILCSGIILSILYIEYRKKKIRYSGLKRMTAIAPLFLLVLAILSYSYSSDYRFQTSESRYYESPEKERRIAGQGMSPEGLGWGEEDYIFTVNSSNLACKWERIIYRKEAMERPVDYRKPEYARRLRYIGTLRAELKKADYLDRYLSQKGLTLENSILFHTDNGMSYYLTRTGKEIIGVDGKKLVIYFLNNYDERSFDPSDGRLLGEIKRLDESVFFK